MLTDIAPLMQVSAKDIAEKLGGKRRGQGKWLASCPAHVERTPSFYIQEGDDVPAIFKCFGGCDQTSVINALKGMGLWSSDGIASALRSERTAIDYEQERLKAKTKALQIWHQSRIVEPGDPVHAYLTKTRQLPLNEIPATIRCNYDLDYWTSENDQPVKVASTPAMVAAIQNVQGEIIAVHRTYLTHDGTKFDPVKYGYAGLPVKKVQGKEIQGAAIRLQEPGDTLIVAEGIETALAAHILSGLPAWAAVSAGGLERLEVPESVSTVYICVDNDAAGEKASKALAGRLQRLGKRVTMSYASKIGAPEKGDFADLMRGVA